MSSPAPPQRKGAQTPTSKKTYTGQSGRKLVETPSENKKNTKTPKAPEVKTPKAKSSNVLGETAASNAKKFGAGNAADVIDGIDEKALKMLKEDTADIEDFERLLDNDNIAVLNMKRDFKESQQEELQKFREDLSRVKREYDNIRINNDIKERQMLEYAGKIKMLMGVSEADGTTGVVFEDIKKKLQKVLEEAEDNLAAEQRTQRMLNLMAFRLDEETNDCRAEGSKVILGLETCRFDYMNADQVYRMSKNEFLEQEKILSGLQTTIRTRKGKLSSQMNTIKNIITDGENSLQKIQEGGTVLTLTQGQGQGQGLTSTSAPGSPNAQDRHIPGGNSNQKAIDALTKSDKNSTASHDGMASTQNLDAKNANSGDNEGKGGGEGEGEEKGEPKDADGHDDDDASSISSANADSDGGGGGGGKPAKAKSSDKEGTTGADVGQFNATGESFGALSATGPQTQAEPQARTVTFRASIHSPRNRRKQVRAMFRSQREIQATRDHIQAQLAAYSDAEFESRKGLTMAQIQDMVERYRTRDERMTKIEQTDADLKSSIAMQKERKAALLDELEFTASRRQQLMLEHRSVYQEIDEKKTTLSGVQKELNELREQDQRVKASIEALRKEFPRFIAKLKKVAHTQISIEELPSAINKLEDEISNMVKDIDAAMMKNISPEDAQEFEASNVNNNNNILQSSETVSAQSEMGRLQKTPGFARLKKLLMVNLMIAPPDLTQRNLRVITEDVKKQAEITGFIPIAPSGDTKPSRSRRRNLNRTASSKGFDDDAASEVGSVRSSYSARSERTSKTLKSLGMGATASAAGLTAADRSRLMAEGKTIEEIEEELYIATGQRPPSPSFDRAAIKGVSQLIIERDMNNRKAKQKADEARLKKEREEWFKSKS